MLSVFHAFPPLNPMLGKENTVSALPEFTTQWRRMACARVTSTMHSVKLYDRGEG